jgi:hypothetical protein
VARVAEGGGSVAAQSDPFMAIFNQGVPSLSHNEKSYESRVGDQSTRNKKRSKFNMFKKNHGASGIGSGESGELRFQSAARVGDI